MSVDVGTGARAAALTLLESALDRRGGFDEAAARPDFLKRPVSERAFARALAMAAIRNLGRIDRSLDGRLERRPNAAVWSLLRIGAAQLFFMDTPDFAAVSTTVKLAERDDRARPFKGLVNGVLRGLARDGLAETPPEANAPDWIVQRWKANYGEAAARDIARSVVREPPTDLSLLRAADAERLAVDLEAEILPGGSLRTKRRGDPAGWPHFDEGLWWVQDAAAAVPVRAIAPRSGETVVDLCAAPGGKTLQIAAAGAATTAVDRSATRLRRLSENLARTNLKAEVIAADAEAWADDRRFDAVLLDAPCTATGTFRRNPDVLWATRPGDIAKLADVQHRLLDAAAERVAPGGRLVYCVCSLEREEGETQILAFLKRRPDFALARLDPAACGAPEESLAPEGWLRILPCFWETRGGLDGFFVARMDRAT